MTDKIPDVGAAAPSAEFEEDDPNDDDPGRDNWHEDAGFDLASEDEEGISPAVRQERMRYNRRLLESTGSLMLDPSVHSLIFAAAIILRPVKSACLDLQHAAPSQETLASLNAVYKRLDDILDPEKRSSILAPARSPLTAGALPVGCDILSAARPWTWRDWYDQDALDIALRLEEEPLWRPPTAQRPTASAGAASGAGGAGGADDDSHLDGGLSADLLQWHDFKDRVLRALGSTGDHGDGGREGASAYSVRLCCQSQRCSPKWRDEMPCKVLDTYKGVVARSV